MHLKEKTLRDMAHIRGGKVSFGLDLLIFQG